LMRRINGPQNTRSNTHVEVPLATDKQRPIKERVFWWLYSHAVILDYLRFGAIKAWLPTLAHKDKIMIFDRYAYDVLFSLANEFRFEKTKIEQLWRVHKALLPRIDLTFIVNVPPEVSYARKREEITSVQHAERIQRDQQELCALLQAESSGKTVEIDNTGDIEAAKAKVLETALDFLFKNEHST
ncbi:MAG: hypothetical protein WBZ42_01520, partial [Halobacteriota archaeon]